MRGRSSKATRPWAALPGIVMLAISCEAEPEALTPYGETRVVIDTDAPVPSLMSSLRIDIYTLDGEWLLSEDIFRGDPSTWPVSFSLYTPDETAGRDVLLRIRGYPDGKVRDYRGDKFTPPVDVDESLDSCVPPGDTMNKVLLLRDDELQLILGDDGEPIDVTPLEEPLPALTVDRLVHIRLEPGIVGTLPITLASACFGSEVNLGERQSCVDTEQVYVSVDPVTPATLASIGPSNQGSFPAVSACGPAPTGDGLEETVCIEGGAFELGDPAVFGFGEFDGFPERVAALPTFWMSRQEVTVGAFRSAADAGLLDGVALPVANEASLATSATQGDATRRCTYSDTPRERESHPVNCVSWLTARAYCQAFGGDLPTEAQWEFAAAAAGRERQDRYPWGSEPPTCSTAIFARSDDPSLGATDCAAQGFGVQSVDASEQAADVTEVYGLVGLGGNVAEWTRDSYRSYCSSCWQAAAIVDPICDDELAERRTIRGGDWAGSAETTLAAIRDEGLAPDDVSDRVGFRCIWNSE